MTKLKLLAAAMLAALTVPLGAEAQDACPISAARRWWS